jgi:hypothetical protein
MKEYFKYFVGKAVTITTVQINFRFKEEAMADYFSGILEIIDEKGLWLLHLATKSRTFILYSYVVSITEEQMLFEDNPVDAKIIEEYRKEKPLTAAKHVIPPKFVQETSFVNPAALAEIAKKAKQAFNEEKK